MTHTSSPDLLVLHAVRVSGFADGTAVSRRTGVDQDTVGELLPDFEAYGWGTHAAFGPTSGWTLTERGRDEDSRKLGRELEEPGARDAAEQAHKAFEILNGQLVRACTDR
ncbi:hypothetical protein ACFY9Q_06245 [Streptomyces sp. NPDC012389]|uniref:hypothetical protein n=1 Tax=Streptomyces sp. NPDC012389 TaxID=3364830 RepID=UPI0036EEB1C3